MYLDYSCIEEEEETKLLLSSLNSQNIFSTYFFMKIYTVYYPTLCCF